MPRRPAVATQADIARALRAAKEVGATVAVEIAPDGTIRLVPAETLKVQAPKPPRRPVPL